MLVRGGSPRRAKPSGNRPPGRRAPRKETARYCVGAAALGGPIVVSPFAHLGRFQNAGGPGVPPLRVFLEAGRKCKGRTPAGRTREANRPTKKEKAPDKERLSEAFGASGPVSRVLSFKTAIYLDAPLPTRSSRLPGTAGPACVSLHGVAPDRVYSDGRFHTPSGELLPRLSR